MARGREQAADRSPDAGEPTGQGAKTTGDWADLDFVRGLIEMVDSSGIDSVEITRAGTRVKIAKTPPGFGSAYGGGLAYPPAMAPFMGMPGMPTMPAGSAGGNAAASPTSEATSEAGAAGTAEAGSAAPTPGGGGAAVTETGLVEVKSPMVGTFYRAPAPEAPPYVEVGTRVTKGQTLCILEAMKLMNELESEIEGVVRQVMVENADPVEYGQVLFRIDPNG